MAEMDETPVDRALGTVWEWTWGLLFVCTMTVLSMATQRYSGYSAPSGFTDVHAASSSARMLQEPRR